MNGNGTCHSPSDETVNQLPATASAFAPSFFRSAGGVRRHVGSGATYGLREAREFERATAAGIIINGPDTDPTAQLDADGGVVLRHPRRRLYGLTLDQSVGSVVVRVEAAHIPDQPVSSSLPSETVPRRARTLVGLAADWVGPAGDIL